MNFLKIVLFSLFLFGAASSFALIQNDQNDVKFLKINEENVVVLDRGIEDGVEHGDHIKLTNPNGFIARAICVRTGMITSHWKIYRVVYPEKISKDLKYVMTAINTSEIPPQYREYKQDDWSEDFENFSESELVAWSKKEDDETIVTDLPDNMKGDPILEPDPSFGTRNFDAQQFREDFKVWTFRFGIEPFSLTSTRNTSKTQSMNTNLLVENKGKKYNLELRLIRDSSKTEGFEQDFNDNDNDGNFEELVETKTSNRNDNTNVTFRIFNIIPRLEANSSYTLNKTYFNRFLTTVTTDVAPLGITFTAIKPEFEGDEPPWQLSLKPSYNKVVQYFKEPQFDFETGETFTSQTTKTLALTLRSEIQFQLGSVSIINETEWAPRIDPARPKKFNTSDVTIYNNLQISFPISTSLFGALVHEYQYSYLAEFGPLSDQKTNITTSLQLNYFYEL